VFFAGVTHWHCIDIVLPYW